MQKNLTTLGVIAILGASLAISGFAIQDAMAANSANKSSFQSADMTAIRAANFGDDVGLGDVPLAFASIKASNPQDVLIIYDEECALYTEVQLKGKHQDKESDIATETDEVRATHKVQLIIDDKAYGDPVTMCDRTYGVSTNILDELEELCIVVENDPDTTADDGLSCDPIFYNSWIQTKAAHGWHWVVVNLGEDHDLNNDGMVEFVINGTVTTVDSHDESTTSVGVGLRSLTVIPIQLDVDA